MRDVAYWEDCINRLKKEPDSCIKEALQTSFNSLPSKNDKELFKHISCFFVGEDRELTETILKACDINTKSGITNLIDRCLVSIGENNELMMHSLILEMGRDLVREESPDRPWERSRLWCHEESLKVLAQKNTENLIGLVLDMRMLEKEKLSGSLRVKTKALSKMENLKLLQLNYTKMSGSYKNLPKELRWLCMHGFHLKSIPSELSMENLVALDLSHSNITSFDMSYSKSQRVVHRLKGLTGSSSVKKRFGSLKVRDLRFCEKLHNISGFSELPLLERLIISNCTILIEVSESIGHCVELVFIDVSNCRRLKMLPRTIGKLKKVKTLLSNGCDILIIPTEIRDMDSLQTLTADGVGIHSQTSSSGNVKVIPRDMTFFTSLPISLVNLSLKNNNLFTESFPMEFSSLSVLKNLYLDDNPIVSMPGCLSSLPCLEVLSMKDCKMLKTVEHPPISLRTLTLGKYFKLQKIMFYQEMSSLHLQLGDLRADSPFVIEGMIKLQPLAQVEDEICYEFGIFSSTYEGKEMPYFISWRSRGSSISFTIPSSLNKLRGLNVCCALESVSDARDGIQRPVIVICNVRKTRTWIYSQFDYRLPEEDWHVIYLSHWMFEKNEMEDGDQLTISIVNINEGGVIIRECGVGFVYDDGRMKEDVLSYYKSWNHIIGGDLSAFRTTTGEYLLAYTFFLVTWKYFHILSHSL